MAKRLNTGIIDSATIKSEADIPAQVDMTTGTGYVDCVNISLSAVKTLLGASTYSLYDICRTDATFVTGGESGKINAWARYKPGVVTYNDPTPDNAWSNPTFTYTKPNACSLGSFAGYNHGENTKPVYWATPPSASYGTVYLGMVNQTYNSGLGMGRLCPILGTSPEDEDYWDRVKVYIYVKEDSAEYYTAWYPSDTGVYLDLTTSPALYEMGAHGEGSGHTYTVYLQPWYYDAEDAQEAACEGGYASFTYTVKTFDQFLIDYHFIASSDMSTAHHDGKHKIYCASGSGITLTNNGHGETLHWHANLNKYYRLKITDITPGTGGTFYENIGQLEIPTDDHVHWNISGDYIDVETNIGACTEAEVVIQCSLEGSTWYDWDTFDPFYWT